MIKVFIKFLILTSVCYSCIATAITGTSDQVRRAEKIEEQSQEVATYYLYTNQRISISTSEKGLKDSLEKLKQNINGLFVGSDPEQKALVEFMSFTFDELDATIKQPYSLENASFIIDYCESLLEAAEYIKDLHHSQNPSDELLMLIKTQEMEYLIVRANRYYIAFRAGIKDVNAKKQMQDTIDAFDERLSTVNQYTGYEDTQKENLQTVNRYWSRVKNLYLGIEKNSLPRVVLASTEYLLKSIDVLVDYHFAASDKTEKKLGG